MFFGFPGGTRGASLVAQRVNHLPTMWETWVQSLGQEDTLEKEWQPTPVLLPGKSHEQRSLVGYSPQGCKESDMIELFHFSLVVKNPPANAGDLREEGSSLGSGNPLENGMAIHSNFLA